MGLSGKLVRFLSSYGLSVAILFLMFVVTLLGTLAQESMGLYKAQKVYFESWFFQAVEFEGPIGIYLPGGKALMVTLAVNLLLGGILRVRWSFARLGVIVTHLGIALLLLAGYVKYAFSYEGSVALYEGESETEFQSYHDWEIVIEEQVSDGLRQYSIPDDQFERAGGGRSATFETAELPFSFTVSNFMENSRIMPKGPMFTVDVPVVDDFFLQEQPFDKEAARNIAGAYLTVDPDDGEPYEAILWGRERQPLTITAGGRAFAVDLRKRRFPLPFEIRLDKFTHEFHPGTQMAREYMSDVTVFDGPMPQPVKIRMNEPLRRGGLVAFQSSYGPQDARPGDPMFSVFAVVRNPSDQWPLYSCIIISIGMLLHFGRKLSRYVQNEVRNEVSTS